MVLIVDFCNFRDQIILCPISRYNYYHAAALSDQLKQYQIPAARGIIEAQEGNNIVPIVLNQTLYTLFADPPLVKNASKDASIIASVIGGSVSQYNAAMKTTGTQYVVLANKITQPHSPSSILKHQFPGIGTRSSKLSEYTPTAA